MISVQQGFGDENGTASASGYRRLITARGEQPSVASMMSKLHLCITEDMLDSKVATFFFSRRERR